MATIDWKPSSDSPDLRMPESRGALRLYFDEFFDILNISMEAFGVQSLVLCNRTIRLI
jgi:hypothetical protein